MKKIGKRLNFLCLVKKIKPFFWWVFFDKKYVKFDRRFSQLDCVSIEISVYLSMVLCVNTFQHRRTSSFSHKYRNFSHIDIRNSFFSKKRTNLDSKLLEWGFDNLRMAPQIIEELKMMDSHHLWFRINIYINLLEWNIL